MSTIVTAAALLMVFLSIRLIPYYHALMVGFGGARIAGLVLQRMWDVCRADRLSFCGGGQ